MQLTVVLSALLAAGEPPDYETVILGGANAPSETLPSERPQSTVDREEIERRLPRSAPDALRYETGVFVQQTAHAQGSPFIRGLTGQQILLLFDGIRLNNSTYRQGPSQYFFTVDSQSVQAIDVMRGGGATRWGSDALGGVIIARPIEPLRASGDELRVEPLVRAMGSSADLGWGGRLQSHVAAGELGFFGGVGGRRIGLLESGGRGGRGTLVPRFAEDGRTQLGTGFDELTGDARLVWRPREDQSLTLASYAYRQYDAPRTDQCPPAEAPDSECLTYQEQFRTLVYAAWEGRLGAAAEVVRATVSWQRAHERRRRDRPAWHTRYVWRDDVDTLGVTLAGSTRSVALLDGVRLRLGWGADAYYDSIASAAWRRLTNIDVVRPDRATFIDGSTYFYGGAYLEGMLVLPAGVKLRAGGRVSRIEARSAADASSSTAAVDASWTPLGGHAGVQWQALPGFTLLANLDRSFRAPNLDDLTGRQVTGPGFQIENPALGPERALTTEIGARLALPIVVDLWLFRTRIERAIGRVLRLPDECPPESFECAGARTRLQLVNAEDVSEVRGVEASLAAELPFALRAHAAISWTWGEGPLHSDPRRRVPLSRVPPLNGAGELTWSHASSFYAAAGVRWAGEQTRLAVSDRSDARIPPGGTPGFVVADLRFGFGLEHFETAVVLENLFDAAYRYHGSSVNGPGRGVMLRIDWRAF